MGVGVRMHLHVREAGQWVCSSLGAKVSFRTSHLLPLAPSRPTQAWSGMRSWGTMWRGGRRRSPLCSWCVGAQQGGTGRNGVEWGGAGWSRAEQGGTGTSARRFVASIWFWFCTLKLAINCTQPQSLQNPGATLNHKYSGEIAIRSSGFPYCVVRATGERVCV